MVAPALAAAGIQAAASIFGGITGGKGAKKSAKIAAASAAADRAQALSIYNTNMDMARPAVDRGNRASAQIDALAGLGGDPAAARDALATFRAASGYQDRLNEGLRAVNTGYAARGALESGAAQKALAQYGANLAGQSFGQYVDVLQGQRSAGLAAMGAATGAGAAYQAATQSANAAASSAQANAALYGAQATQNALAGASSAFGNYFGQQDWDQRMRSSFPSPVASPGLTTPGRSYGYGGTGFGDGILNRPFVQPINFGIGNPFG